MVASRYFPNSVTKKIPSYAKPKLINSNGQKIILIVEIPFKEVQ
jgi:hypothetical protein